MKSSISAHDVVKAMHRVSCNGVALISLGLPPMGLYHSGCSEEVGMEICQAFKKLVGLSKQPNNMLLCRVFCSVSGPLSLPSLKVCFSLISQK